MRTTEKTSLFGTRWLSSLGIGSQDLRLLQARVADLLDLGRLARPQGPICQNRCFAIICTITQKTGKRVRDRAILAALLYHGLRCDELCQLRVKDMQSRQGVMHFRVKGKRDTIRFVPIHPVVQRLILEYMEMGKHGGGIVFDPGGPLFRPVANNRTGTLDKHLFPGSLYYNVVIKYAKATGISAEAIGVCVHSMRATAATNALSNEADIAKVQEWLGHANVSTTDYMTGARRGLKIVRRFM
jgi:integrase